MKRIKRSYIKMYELCSIPNFECANFAVYTVALNKMSYFSIENDWWCIIEHAFLSHKQTNQLAYTHIKDVVAKKWYILTVHAAE